VSNVNKCVDCSRIADGKRPIYSTVVPGDDLTGVITYGNPVANSKFHWTDEKETQLLSAWVNTGGDMLAAAKIVGAQPEAVIDHLAESTEFKAKYEASVLKKDVVQLWGMESRASGNDRVGLSMAQSKFTEFGAKSGLADRPSINPEQMRAELAQIVSSVKRSLDQQDGLRATIRVNRPVGQTNGPAADTADESVEESPVLAPPYDGSDLV
jgi:hypothetical protein